MRCIPGQKYDIPGGTSAMVVLHPIVQEYSNTSDDTKLPTIKGIQLVTTRTVLLHDQTGSEEYQHGSLLTREYT
jgi:hypothetical protein